MGLIIRIILFKNVTLTTKSTMALFGLSSMIVMQVCKLLLMGCHSTLISVPCSFLVMFAIAQTFQYHVHFILLRWIPFFSCWNIVNNEYICFIFVYIKSIYAFYMYISKVIYISFILCIYLKYTILNSYKKLSHF